MAEVTEKKKAKEQDKAPEKKDSKKKNNQEARLEELTAEKQAAEKKLAEANDNLMRTLAEYDNFRKRSQREKASIYLDTKAEVIEKLLPIIDNFERAALHTDADAETYRKGVEMTVAQLLEAVKALGVESFGEKGDSFDPNMHNAVMHGEDEALGESSVSDVFAKGYRLGDKIIRPATVKVVN